MQDRSAREEHMVFVLVFDVQKLLLVLGINLVLDLRRGLASEHRFVDLS